ncbi:MAG: TolC family protein, partial [bacterium]|nr:TolC family protein [bacterium]
MSRQFKTSLTLLLLTLVVATGCHPTQPLYLRSDGDLSHYIEQATDLEYPDTQYTSLEDVEQARHPFTVGEFEDAEKWSLSLEECVSMALHNSKVIRRLDQTTTPGTPQQFISNPESFQTVYDPSIFETDPDAGVHAALAQFDTQLNAGLYGGQNPGADGLGGYTNVDVPQNNNALGNAIFAPTFEQTTATMQAELAKRTASGATFRARHTLAYDRNNRPTNAVSSTWDTRFQIEATLPLLRGRGAQVNRVGVSVARINTDIALADFEASVRNMTSDVEAAYWNLYCAYRFLEVQKEARDAALQAAQASRAKRGKILPRYDSARASELYFRYRGDVEQQLRTLYDAESNLRFLMGLAHTDGRLILPGDEPTTARVDFNYNEAHTEALVRTAELRRQKWRVKQRELQLIAARNNLLPQLDAFAQYTWLG